MKDLEELTKSERKFYLSIPKGIENAIPAKKLAVITGMNTRTLTAHANHLRRKGYPIGASHDSVNGGYYIITNAEELNVTVRTLEAYGKKQLQSAYALKKGWRDRHNRKEVKDNETTI